MSTYEDSYKSPLQGVSQQIPRERLDGQLTAQENMLSDIVTNLRRRLGAAFAYSIPLPSGNVDSIKAWGTDLDGVQVQVILNTATGVVRLLDVNYATLAVLPAQPYLITTNSANIRASTVGDEFFLLNVEKKPVAGASSTVVDPAKRGFFYAVSSAFSKAYAVTLKTTSGTYTYTYTTPTGATVGDAALSSIEYIATQLTDLINADTATHGCTATKSAAYVYVQTTQASLVLSTGTGSFYMKASDSAYIKSSADLPTTLPVGADGFIMATTSQKSPVFFVYQASTFAWLEVGDYVSPLTITNVPISITNIANAWVVLNLDFEGRFAGSELNNPNPAFLENGITGMGSYQGRLVLLSGSSVHMSASLKPRRYYRSTVTGIIASDTISVGASAASSAAYQYCVPFQKDLLLFSSKYQALVPGGTVALAPSTATVVVTSAYESDMTSSPIPVGRTVMYSTPRSREFFGLMEMVPSSNVDAQYDSFDTTAHLPKYMAGKMRFSVASSVANMVLFSPSNDTSTLIVHEYTWSGDTKVQQSWHRWSFAYPVAAAYFSGQVVHVLFIQNNTLVACTIDPRSSVVTQNAEKRPYLDFNVFGDVVDGVITPPSWMTTFDPSILPKLRLAVATGSMSGTLVGSTVQGSTLSTVASFPSGRVSIGIPYMSVFSPTPPMEKDSQGVKVSTNKLTVVRYMLSTNNSGAFNVTVSDRLNTDVDLPESPLTYSSTELSPGYSLIAGDSTTVIPARHNAEGSSLLVSTDGMFEMNIVGLEYVARYNAKVKRKQHRIG